MTAEPTRANLVEVDDLHFQYGGRQILKGLSLSIARGKVVAILGTSGSGKTTLLRLHRAGSCGPRRGRVRVEGKVVHELDDEGSTSCGAGWGCSSR